VLCKTHREGRERSKSETKQAGAKPIRKHLPSTLERNGKEPRCTSREGGGKRLGSKTAEYTLKRGPECLPKSTPQLIRPRLRGTKVFVLEAEENRIHKPPEGKFT